MILLLFAAARKPVSDEEFELPELPQEVRGNNAQEEPAFVYSSVCVTLLSYENNVLKLLAVIISTLYLYLMW